MLFFAFLPIFVISTASAQESTASTPSSSDSNATGVIPQLEQAYNTLSHADHDYQGHRAKAMCHIKAAIRKLGASYSAVDGKVKEAQAASDDQLRSAQGILELVQPQVTARVLFHVQKAIEEINVALSIR